MSRIVTILSAFALMLLAACGGGQRSVVVPSGGGGWVGGSVPQLGDNAPHEWVGGHPYNHAVHGIDISRWQGQIDWNRARTSGVSFAFLKATEGADHSDPEFQRYWREAGNARIPRGAYHYYYFCRSGAEQAAWFIRNVPREAGSLPPVLDIEWTHSRTCPRRPGSAEILREASNFIAILERHYGQRPIIYTTVDFYRDTGIGRLNAEFWLRSVAGHPRQVYPGQRWTFWQYTGTGSVPGIRGNVDLNAFAGSVSDWRTWLNRRLVR
ncbi:glycoside hydrolase family 25 protein [Paracoccus aurantiacus]|uniref:Glycoside hydrolase family 25 protein n=1 Tax=Paracoccus aurantiacus TaxID=2599412 RepID=A0A5C6S513_9RHOB|nr:GH25 family lysozyme [Paracoccus aurantiacus]TXB69071.1 glycoside hydrolase family 25 protein [Paracoccus aurantiacus]